MAAVCTVQAGRSRRGVGGGRAGSGARPGGGARAGGCGGCGRGPRCPRWGSGGDGEPLALERGLQFAGAVRRRGRRELESWEVDTAPRDKQRKGNAEWECRKNNGRVLTCSLAQRFPYCPRRRRHPHPAPACPWGRPPSAAAAYPRLLGRCGGKRELSSLPVVALQRFCLWAPRSFGPSRVRRCPPLLQIPLFRRARIRAAMRYSLCDSLPRRRRPAQWRWRSISSMSARDVGQTAKR
jgi:hypothetical protein